MDAVLRRAVGAGLPVPEAVAAASATPARVLGIEDRVGSLRPGLAANLVIMDEAWRLRAVMRHGQWLTAGP
jgi:N-acetylglucosamine-6-phosphate deacetylase